MSLTLAPMAVLGPGLVAVIVWVNRGAGHRARPTPSVLVSARSACGVSVSVSVAVLLAEKGSVKPAGAATVAVLASVPVAVGATVPIAVNVTDRRPAG